MSLLETLGFYQVVHQKKILDPQAFRQTGQHAVPQAALRMQALLEILDKFPRCKASWEQAAAATEVEQPPNPFDPVGKEGDQGIARVIVNHLMLQDVIPKELNIVDAQEHSTSSHYRERRKYRNPMYNEYCREVPANMFQPNIDSAAVRFMWSRVPLHLKYLIVSDSA